MRCLENEKICGKTLKCKDCMFDDCKNTLKVLEDMEKEKEELKLKSIKRQLPEACKECSMLKVLNAEKEKVYCPYMLKNECLIGSYINNKKMDNLVDELLLEMR